MEKHLDRSGHGNSQDSTEESAQNQRPNEDGDDDRHGVKANGFADDLGRDEESIDLLHGGKDDRDHQRQGPPGSAIGEEGARTLHGSDDDCGHPAEDDSEIGDHAQQAKHEADEQSEIQTQNHESDACGEAIDQAHEELSAEEGDQVAIDLREAIDHLGFKIRRSKREVMGPGLFDVGTLREEVKKVEWHDDEGEQKTKDPHETADACFHEPPGVFDQRRQGRAHPVPRDETLEVKIIHGIGEFDLGIGGF